MQQTERVKKTGSVVKSWPSMISCGHDVVSVICEHAVVLHYSLVAARANFLEYLQWKQIETKGILNLNIHPSCNKILYLLIINIDSDVEVV